jgi:hypothetical protein
MTKTKKQLTREELAKVFNGNCEPAFTSAWFAKHKVIPVLVSGTYFGREVYAPESDQVFLNEDGSEEMRCEISYEEGCPTCGGAYIKRWTWRLIEK